MTVGDDGGDRLALVADLLDRERRLVVLAEIDKAEQRVEITGYVGAADDPAHAPTALSFARVDGRMRACEWGLRRSLRCSMPCNLWSLK